MQEINAHAKLISNIMRNNNISKELKMEVLEGHLKKTVVIIQATCNNAFTAYVVNYENYHNNSRDSSP